MITDAEAKADGDSGKLGRISPEDSFLVQVRGGSRLAARAISGRVEHLPTGRSEPFDSLAELFDFLARHFSEPGSG